MFNKEAIELLQEGAAIKQASEAILGITDAGAVALPEHFKLHDLETYMHVRRRARGVMVTHALSDFAIYTKAHTEEGATVFIDADEMSATAVLNLGTAADPGHTDNRAKVKLLLARQTALTSGQLFEKLTLTMQRNYLTLSENMLATIERCAKVTW